MENTFLRVGFILLLILLVINVFAYTLFGTSNHIITVSEFLDRLDEAPTLNIELSVAMQDFKITDDWGVFNGFRDFLNIFAQVLGFLVWLGSVFVDIMICLGYLLYLLGLSSFSAFV